jgi:hypothetical protein
MSGSEGSLHLQSDRRRLNLSLLAIRTNDFILPYFDHLRLGFRQFCDLVDLDQTPSLCAQIRMALAAVLWRYMDHFIGLRHELALVFLVPQRWTVPPLAPSFGLITLLIPGGRLRRILRRCRRLLLVLLEFLLQGLIVRLKFGQLLGLFQDQIDQLFFSQCFQVFSGHRPTILPNFVGFKQPGE